MSKRFSIPSNDKGRAKAGQAPLRNAKIDAARKVRRRIVIIMAFVAFLCFVAAAVLLQRAERANEQAVPVSANPVMGMLNRKDQAEAVKSSLNVQAWLKDIYAEVANRRGELSGYRTFNEAAALLDSAQADPGAAADTLRRGVPAVAAFRDELAAERDPAKAERNKLLLENLNRVLRTEGK